MANEGRFLGKVMARFDGIINAVGAAMFLDGNTMVHNGPVNVEGDVTATGLIGATVTVKGDLTATGIVANTIKFKGSTALTNIWGVIASLDLDAIAPHGSLTSVAVADVAMSGAGVGDLVFGGPIGSCHAGLLWGVCCHSAGNVQVRATYTGSGDYDAGVIPFKVYCIK